MSELLNAGKFLEIDDAKSYLQEFLNAEASSVVGDVTQSVVAGQVLGLTQLQTFMDAITAFNDNDQHPTKIEAVRIYYALSDRSGQHDKKLRDIILEPVLADGKDLHKLFPQLLINDNLILGEAIPCPNLCEKSFNLDCG